MSEIEKDTDQYIAAVKSTETYKRYCFCKEQVKANPELWQQIAEYRRKKFEFQNIASSDELYDKMDAFEREYEYLWENQKVSDFLEAELAFCRMIQESSLRIVKEMEFE